jgi:hypothetical protein
MSNVGIPIKLLYEAEGMKVTVEVSLLVSIVIIFEWPMDRFMTCIGGSYYFVYVIYHGKVFFSRLSNFQQQ